MVCAWHFHDLGPDWPFLDAFWICANSNHSDSNKILHICNKYHWNEFDVCVPPELLDQVRFHDKLDIVEEFVYHGQLEHVYPRAIYSWISLHILSRFELQL